MVLNSCYILLLFESYLQCQFSVHKFAHAFCEYVVAVLQCIAKLLEHTESNDISLFPLTVDT